MLFPNERVTSGCKKWVKIVACQRTQLDQVSSQCWLKIEAHLRLRLWQPNYSKRCLRFGRHDKAGVDMTEAETGPKADPPTPKVSVSIVTTSQEADVRPSPPDDWRVLLGIARGQDREFLEPD